MKLVNSSRECVLFENQSKEIKDDKLEGFLSQTGSTLLQVYADENCVYQANSLLLVVDKESSPKDIKPLFNEIRALHPYLPVIVCPVSKISIDHDWSSLGELVSPHPLYLEVARGDYQPDIEKVLEGFARYFEGIEAIKDAFPIEEIEPRNGCDGTALIALKVKNKEWKICKNKIEEKLSRANISRFINPNSQDVILLLSVLNQGKSELKVMKEQVGNIVGGPGLNICSYHISPGQGCPDPIEIYHALWPVLGAPGNTAPSQLTVF